MAASAKRQPRSKSSTADRSGKRTSSKIGPERVGQKQLALWVDSEVWRAVHVVALDQSRTCRDVLLNSIGLMLRDVGRPIPKLVRDAMS